MTSARHFDNKRVRASERERNLRHDPSTSAVLPPDIFDHATVEHWPFLMVDGPQFWKHRQYLAFFQQLGAGQIGSFVDVPAQTALADQKAARLQCSEYPRTDITIEMVEHHDQVEVARFELVLRGIKCKQV